MAPVAAQDVQMSIRPDRCMARTWNGGLGAQCSRKACQLGEFCKFHANDSKWKVHGRVDEPVQNGKLKEIMVRNGMSTKAWLVPQINGVELSCHKQKRAVQSEGAIEAFFNQYHSVPQHQQGLEDIETPPRKGRGRPAKFPKIAVKEGLPQQAAQDLSALTSIQWPPLPVESPGVDPETAKLQRAAASFRAGMPSGGLPCRDAEKDKIFTHISSAVRQGGTSSVLYISGMPGTGKTACVLEVIETVKRVTPPFWLVHVNAMCLATPAAVFGEIHERLPCARVNAQQTKDELQRFFSDRQPSDPVILMLVDEVDLLVTPNQAVLYRLFDWLALPSARLVLVAISNTINLPERLLPRVASRFDIVRLDFEAYTRAQIFEILRRRLQGHDALDAFNETALKLCSARVAAGSGDIRKALQVCRRAVEARLTDGTARGPVMLPHLEAAEKDLLHANPVVQTITGLSCKARRFLAAFALELCRGESDTVPISRVASQYRKLLVAAAMDTIRGHDFTEACDPSEGYAQDVEYEAKRLEAMSLVVRQVERVGRNATGNGGISVFKLGAGLDIEDLVGALMKSEEDEGIKEMLDLRRSS